jgi:hypothetical protein
MYLLNMEHNGKFDGKEVQEDSTEPQPAVLDCSGKPDGLVKMEPINSSRTLGKGSNASSQVRFKSLKSQDSFRSVSQVVK